MTQVPVLSTVDADGDLHALAAPATWRHELAFALDVQAASRSWGDILACVQGAHPLDVFELARSRGEQLPLDCSHVGPPPEDDDPELHQLEEEWYFDEVTSRRLAAEYLFASSSIALGCPTVVREAARMGKQRPLIDMSVGLDSRAQKWETPSALRADLRQDLPSGLDRSFDVVLLDPPWHIEDMATWLSHAVRLCRVGGTIALPLFGRLTKLAAGRERDAVLSAAEMLGPVRLDAGAALYRTPRFEWEACRARGVAAPPAWRAADILTITLQSRAGVQLIRYPSAVRHRWRTWIFDSQVIKLRGVATRSSGEPLQSVDAAVNNVLPSVSRRLTRAAQIGLWTSRQRVQAVANPRLVAEWLDVVTGAKSGPAPPDALLALLR